MNTKEKIRKYVKIFLWVGNLLVLAIPITQKLIGKQGGRVKVVSEKENVRKEEKVIEEEPKPKVVSHDKKQKKHQIRTRQTRIAKKITLSVPLLITTSIVFLAMKWVFSQRRKRRQPENDNTNRQGGGHNHTCGVTPTPS